MRTLLVISLFFAFIFVNVKAEGPAIVNTIYTVVDSTICYDEVLITPEGKEYNLQGIYLDTFALSNVCDSIRELNLTVLDPTNDVIAAESLCEGEAIMICGIMYTTNTVVVKVLTDANGCNYNTVLHLEFQAVPPDLIETVEICEGESFLWPITGQSYTVAGTYTHPGNELCSHNDILELTVIPINDCKVATKEFLPGNQISIYPNPTSEMITIENNAAHASNISIVDLAGRKLIDKLSFYSKTTLDVGSWENGTYYCLIESKDGRIVRRFNKTGK